MIPLTTGRYDWGFVSGRISALEARLLPKEFFATLISQTRTEDVVRMLQDTALKDSLAPGAAWDDLGQVIDRHFLEQVASIRENCPDPSVPNLFLLRGDYLNLKRAALREDGYPFYPLTLDEVTLDRVAAGDLDDLAPEMRAALERCATDTGGYDLSTLDIALDGAYLRHMLRMARALGVPVIDSYIEREVLTEAIVVLLRACHAKRDLAALGELLLPLEPHTDLLNELLATSDVTQWPDVCRGDLEQPLRDAVERPSVERAPAFELAAMNSMRELAQAGSYQVAGPERVFAYLTALSVETYNLKLVASGRLSRIEPDLLRTRLRECHV